MNSVQFWGAVELGLIYGFLSLGVFLTFRVIRFTDLTVDGSFVLGASLTAVLLLKNYPPYMATIAAVFAGVGAGMLTASLNVWFGINDLLAGILTTTALYSVNLRIMGRPNLVVLNSQTLFSFSPIIYLIILALISWLLLYWFFCTTKGLATRALGDNAELVENYGLCPKRLTIGIMGLANGFVGLSGALFVQSQGFADISMGTGSVLVGLASVILGEIFHFTSITWRLVACIGGAVLYRLALALALNSDRWGLQASDVSLISAVLVGIAMVAPRLKKGLSL